MRDQILNLSDFRASLEVVTFAAGCFWHVEEAFRTVPGVVRTEVGYAAGPYGVAAEAVPCRRDTGHVEATQVWFDPSLVSFDDLLTVFWNRHDPTARHRIEGGVDYRYRSAIFVETERQLAQAEASIDRARVRCGADAVVTTTVALGASFQVAQPAQQQRLKRRSERLAPSA